MSGRLTKPVLVVVFSALALVSVAVAGSLTPSGPIAATMHSLADIYDSIASATFDSSGIVANQNGSLIGNLKYIENQTAWASSSGNIWNLNSGNVGIASSSPDSLLTVRGGNISHVARTNPVEVGRISGIGTPFSVDVVNGIAYVADYNDIRIIDVSNPASPSLMSTFVTPGSASWAQVAGKYLYIADANAVRIADISNPTSPVLVGSVQLSSSSPTAVSPWVVRVSGHYLFAADYTGAKKRFIDVSNPSNPRIVNSQSGPASAPYDFAVSGNYLYVAENNSGFSIWDVSNPASPVFVGNGTGFKVTGLDVIGRYLYTTGTTSRVYDIKNPASPVLVTTFAGGYKLRAQGRYLYVYSGAPQLYVYDVTNQASPNLIGTYTDTAGSAAIVAASIVGEYAYLADYGGTSLVVVKLNGTETPNILTGGLQAGNINVLQDAVIGGGLFARSGLNVGGGGMLVTGEGAIESFSSSSTLTLIQRGRGNLLSLTSSASQIFYIQASSSGNVNMTLQSPSARGTDGKFTLRSAGVFDRLDILNGANSALVSIASTGNVGIGTTAPGAKLDFGTLVGTPLVYAYNGGAATRFGLGIQAFEMQMFVPTNSHFSFNAGGDLQASGTSEVVRIMGTGNVGIGTTNTGLAKLAVAGAASISSDLITFGKLGVGTTVPITGGDGSALVAVSGVNAAVDIAGSSLARIDLRDTGATAGQQALEFMNDNGIFSISRMADNESARKAAFFVLGPTGNVGFGLHTPSNPVTLLYASASNQDSLLDLVNQHDNVHTAGITFQVASVSTGLNKYIWTTGVDQTDAGKYKIAFGTNAINEITGGGSTFFTVTTAGNVGIGSTAPGALLTVSGTASVSGNFGINTNKFYVNAATGNVGIGTKNLTTDTFELLGTASVSGQIRARGGITSPGTGTNSEQFGNNANASGNGGLAIGNGAIAATLNSMAVGNSAVAQTGTGAMAIGFGASATGASGIAIGGANSAGNSAIAIGSQATAPSLQDIIIGLSASGSAGGISQIAIGANAFVRGSRVVAVGNSVQTRASDVIAIGSGVHADANQIVIGNTTTPTTNLFFNFSSSSAPGAFTINGTGGAGTDVVGANLTIAGGRGTGAARGGSLIFQTANGTTTGSGLNTLATRMTIVASGSIGIGTTGPVHLVHIASSGDGNILRLQDTSGTCDHNPDAGAETVTCSSDISLKTNITDAPSVLPYFSDFRIRSYTVISSGKPMTGVIAQELRLTHPEMVATGSDGLLMVQQPNPWLLVKGIQELTASSLMLDQLLTTETISTEPSGPLARLVHNVLAFIEQVFHVRIGDGSVESDALKARNEICVGSVCATEEQFLQMMERSGVTPQSNETPITSATPTPTPTPSAVSAPVSGDTPTPTASPTPDTTTPTPTPTATPPAPTDTPIPPPSDTPVATP